MSGNVLTIGAKGRERMNGVLCSPGSQNGLRGDSDVMEIFVKVSLAEAK